MTGMLATDIGLLNQAGEVRVSPDGAAVTFTVATVDLERNDYRTRIWLAASDGTSAPYPFSAGERRDHLPRWSPDGRRLAFISEPDRSGESGDTGSEVVILPVTVGGQAVRVAILDDEVSELEWSPDGTRLAFVARARDESQYGTAARPRPENDMPPRRLRHLFFRLDTVGWTVDRPNSRLRRHGGRVEAARGPHRRSLRGLGHQLVAGRPAAGVRIGPARVMGSRPGQRFVARSRRR